MTTTEMTDQERAAKLLDAGLSYLDVARYFGISYGVVRGWFDEEFRVTKLAKAREWKAANKERKAAADRRYALAQRVPCPYCPVLVSPGTAMCCECRMATADVRRSLVEGMWASGWKRGQINAALGLEPQSPYVFVMRAQHGWDLPYRRSPEACANIRAGNPRLKAMAA